MNQIQGSGPVRRKEAKLSPRQASYVAARLAGMTQKLAAEKVSAAPRTARDWDRKPAVADALRVGQDALIAEASGTALALLTPALAKLMAIGNDPDAPSSARVSALKAVCDLALVLRDAHTLSERVAALEAAQRATP